MPPLGGQPVSAGVEAPLLDHQKRPQRQSDVTALGAPLAALTAFHVRHLFQAPMVLFDPPTGVDQAQTIPFVQLQVTRGPVRRRAVLGDDAKHFDEPVPFQMNHRATRGDVAGADGREPRLIRVQPPIGFQPREPRPPQRLQPLQVFQTAVPTVEQHALRRETTLLRHAQQIAEMVVLRLAVVGFVVNPIVTGEVSVTIGPQQGRQVDPLDDAVMFARPHVMNQVHLAGGGLGRARCRPAPAHRRCGEHPTAPRSTASRCRVPAGCNSRV